MFTNLLLLAAETGVEGLSPDHIASKIAVPIGIVIFCGGVFLLLWSNYGAKKGGLIYGVAMFGFCGIIGVFWWFGAPGTPVATGLQNFPGQAADAYQPAWYPFEPGSERAQFFPATNDLGNFETVPEFTGSDDETDPFVSALSGDLESASALMLEQYLPLVDGQLGAVGANKRTMLQENALAEIGPDEEFAEQPYTAEVAVRAGEPQLFVTNDRGQRVAAAELVTYANFVTVEVDQETGVETIVDSRRVEVDSTQWFAFKQPGALWWPSAVWTAISFLLFAICLLALDRIEQREKREDVTVEEAQDVEVPVAQ